MFKLLRRYQNSILVFGGSLLMFVFLVQGVLPSFLHSDPSEQLLGTIRGGRKITLGDQRGAVGELQLLGELRLMPQRQENQDEALRWVLMLDEAGSMGLDASRNEVTQIEGMLGVGGDEATMAQTLARLNATAGQIDRAVRDWDIVQQYQEMAYGLGHLSVEQRFDRIQGLMSFGQRLAQAQSQGELAPWLIGAYEALAKSTQGALRISGTALAHLVQEQSSTLTITAVAVPTDEYLAKVPSVPPAQVTSLFDKYKDRLPGTPDAQGYTFGYKTPDRVKIEYLSVPLSRLREGTRVEEVDILAYYQAHRQDFAPPRAPGATQPAPEAQAPAMPDEQAQARITEMLQDQRAAAECQRVIKAAEAILADQAHALKEDEGYRALAPGWHPMPLEAVAQQVQKQTGVLPDVNRIDNRWLDMAEVAALPDIGDAIIDGTRGTTLAAYVHSAREFSPKGDDALALLHLQVGLPSQPLTGMDGSRYLFRLIAAEEARVPASVDEVRPEVERDARRLAAYELIKADRGRWLAMLERQKSLADLAKELKQPLLAPPAFPQRTASATGMAPPDITGIGRDGPFTDAAFTLASKLALQGDIAALPAVRRSDVIPSNANLTLYLVRIDGMKSITQRQFESEAASPVMAGSVGDMLTSGKAVDALSLAALEKRLAYVPSHPPKGDESGAPSQPPGPAIPSNLLD